MTNLPNLLLNLPLEAKLVLAVLLYQAFVAWGIVTKAGGNLTTEQAAFDASQKISVEGQSEVETGLNALAESRVKTYLLTVLKTGVASKEGFSLQSDIHGARFRAGIFVFIGLLGTVLGLASGVSGLGGAVNANSLSGVKQAASSSATASLLGSQSAQLQSSITTLLSGVQSATLCTLFGILATILVSYRNSGYSQKARALERGVFALAETRLAPLQQVTTEGAQVRVLREIKSVSDKLAKSSEEFTKQLPLMTASIEAANKRAGTLQTEATTFVDSLKQLIFRIKKIYDALEEERSHLGKLSEGIGESAGQMQTDIGVALSGVREEVRLLRSSLEKNSDTQAERNEVFTEEIKTTQKSLQDLLRQFERTLNDVAAYAPEAPLRRELKEMESSLTRALKNHARDNFPDPPTARNPTPDPNGLGFRVDSRRDDSTPRLSNSSTAPAEPFSSASPTALYEPKNQNATALDFPRNSTDATALPPRAVVTTPRSTEQEAEVEPDNLWDKTVFRVKRFFRREK